MLIKITLLMLLSSAAFAHGRNYGGYGSGYTNPSTVYVEPYVKQDGTYVNGYNRTAPNNNPYDNYSTQGNTNPYTGRPGTVNPYGSN